MKNVVRLKKNTKKKPFSEKVTKFSLSGVEKNKQETRSCKIAKEKVK